MFVLDLQSRIPIYEQMKLRIIELVRLGVLTPDEQLPSVRSLARELGVNPNTVQKAYQELERQGIVYSVSGRGSFVSGNTSTAAALLEQARKTLMEAIQRAKLDGITRELALGCIEAVYTAQGGISV